MPAAAANALRPTATRTPLMAITAVHALCRIAKRIPDQPKSFKRDERDSAPSGVSLSCAVSLDVGEVTAESLAKSFRHGQDRSVLISGEFLWIFQSCPAQAASRRDSGD